MIKQVREAALQGQAEIERMVLEGNQTPAAMTNEDAAADSPPADPGAERETPMTGKAQDVALNGAQVTALADIVRSVAAGDLPASAAVEIITVGFPVGREQAQAMVADASRRDSDYQEADVAPVAGGQRTGE
jgi:hypothetical protein